MSQLQPSKATNDDVYKISRSLYEVSAYCDTIFGNREGYLATAFGHNGFYRPSGKYDFKRWEQRFYSYPEGRAQFGADVLEFRHSADVYVCPLLRSEESRRKGTGLPGNYAWAESDQAPPHEAYKLLTTPGALIVRSGRGLHVYLPRKSDEPASELVKLNRRLAKALHADHGHDETKLLRLPGTFNHKARARGGSSFPVEIWRQGR